LKIVSFSFVLLSLGWSCYGQLPDPSIQDMETDEPTIRTPGTVGMGGMTGDPRDFVNLYAFANAVYDSNISYVTQSSRGGDVTTFGGEGGQVGGGVSLHHMIKHGAITLSYNGSFTKYSRSQLTNGTNQFLLASFSKMLTRRWIMNITENLSFISNGSQAFIDVPANGSIPPVQPFGQKIFYDTTALYLSYQQTHRLNYFFGGTLFTSRYRPTNLSGYGGVTGSAGVGYRFTQRTRLDGTYSYSRFSYTTGDASSILNSMTAALMHEVGQHWRLGATVGISHVQSSGEASFLLPGTTGLVLVSGKYKTSTFTPVYTGSATRLFRTGSFTVTGGENVSGGNGVYLTSRNLFINSSGTKQIAKKLTVTGAFGYSRLSSLANAAGTFGAANYGANAGYELTPHIYLTANYTGWHYPKLSGVQRQFATQATAGITFASHNYPIGMF
jgi:hypothetical protein